METQHIKTNGIQQKQSKEESVQQSMLTLKNLRGWRSGLSGGAPGKSEAQYCRKEKKNQKDLK
jgi:hypothetical protein